jgi:coenzyme F420-reducing hydrogenase alpha subunit
VAGYRRFLAEEHRPGSNASYCTVAGETVATGALPRLRLGSSLSPRAGQLFYDNRQRLIGTGMEANPLAQAIELVSAVEQALVLLERLQQLKDEPFRADPPTPKAGSGTACIEAPRGVLIHSYAFDGDGLCTGADIVTPTALNQVALQHDLTACAALHGHLPDAELLALLQRLIRCYDPCISCAVHLVRS